MTHYYTSPKRLSLFNNIRLDEQTGCWNWTGPKSHKGYGRMRFHQKYESVHRIAAHLFMRFPIASEQHVLHHCDNPSCFNPKHLFIGTNLDNVHDRDSKGRQWQMRKTHCKHGHLLSDGVRYRGKRYCRACAAQRMRYFRAKV